MENHTNVISPIMPQAVVKEEPIDAGNHSVPQCQMQLMSNDEETDQRSVCTPESQENEARAFLSKCVFCCKIFTCDDNPKLLECLHAACASCINNKLTDQNLYTDSDIVLDGNVVVCQICNVASQVENLIENRFFAKFIDDDCNQCTDDDRRENEDDKKCTSCHDNAIATSWCVDCEEFICQNCVMAHQRLKITKDHTIKPKDEVSNETENSKLSEKKLSTNLFCTVHNQEHLSLFCQTCDQLTCRDCQLSHHRDHKYKFIHEIAAETRTSVSTLLKEVSYKRVLLKSAMKVIEDRQVLIVDKKKSLVQEITQMVVQLTNAISTRGKQLIMRLNEVCDQKQNTLNEKKIALDQLSKLTDHCIQFVTYALEKGSDMELLYNKKSVTGHLQRIKNRRADIPNPEIPVRIHLSLEKVTDLIKVVSSIGAIVVDGRVYPSVSPSSGTSTPTTPSNETHTDPKQLIPFTTTSSNDIASATIPIMQQSPIHQHNSFSSPPMSYSQQQHPQQQQQQQSQQHQQQQSQATSSQLNQQQLNQSQLISIQQSQQSIQSQNYLPNYPGYTMPTRTSPQIQHQPRIPSYTMTFNNNNMRSQLMMSQRPGMVNQQQVTSSTHPQQQIHLEQMGQNASLRCLLAHNPPPFRSVSNHVTYRLPLGYRYPASGVATSPRPGPSHTYQPTNPALVSGGRVQQMNPTSVLNQSINFPLHQQQTARWHIPQTANASISYYQPRLSALPLHTTPVTVPNDAYKIMLKTQQNNSNNSNNNNNNNSGSSSSNNNNNNNSNNNHNNNSNVNNNNGSLSGNNNNSSSGGGSSGNSGSSSSSNCNNVNNNSNNNNNNVNSNNTSNNIQKSVSNIENTDVINENSLQPQNIASTSGQTVTSSVPKTPSPVPTSKTDESEKSLDKFCQNSLNDLMLTIAKLDSNGIVVIPEAQKNHLDSTQVDSSTDERLNALTDTTLDNAKSTAVSLTKDDPNEDWCAVCMDGGDAVLCCDKCPKVFHLYCHIPSLKSFPDESETWQCMLCTNVLDCSADPPTEKRIHNMNLKELRIAQRIVLELYCQYEQSLPFREVVSSEIVEYHRIIKKPMAMDIIRDKLKPDHPNHYVELKQVMADIRLMFKNAFTYNPVDSQVYQHARNLEEFFEKLLLKWAPNYAYDDPFLTAEGEEDEEVFPPNRKYRRIISD